LQAKEKSPDESGLSFHWATGCSGPYLNIRRPSVGKEVFGKEHIRITNVCFSTYDTTRLKNKFQVFNQIVTEPSNTELSELDFCNRVRFQEEFAAK